MTNYNKRKSLPILTLAALVFLAHGGVLFAQEFFPETGGAAHSIFLAAARSGQDALSSERDLRDALINNPPFSGSASVTAAPAVPPSPAPPKVQPAYAPSAPEPSPGIPEVQVRGYSIDPSGNINIVGMDGVTRTLDGSKQVKLIFPPEYGLAPQIVGGAPAPSSVSQPQVAPAPAKNSGSTTDSRQDGTGIFIWQMQKGRR